MNLFPFDLIVHATTVLKTCQKAGLKIATAESCTGGLICAVLTEIPGASKVVECGFVTYSNSAKTEILNVPAELLRTHGAVSESVARAMAEGVLSRCPDVALTLGVTGIAGSEGGSLEQPVGLVHLAAARRGADTLHRRVLFPGDRTAVRLATIAAALTLLQALITPASEGEGS